MPRGIVPIDNAIAGSRKIVNSPKVNEGFKNYHRERLKKLIAAKARGVKTVKIGEKL